MIGYRIFIAPPGTSPADRDAWTDLGVSSRISMEESFFLERRVWIELDRDTVQREQEREATEAARLEPGSAGW